MLRDRIILLRNTFGYSKAAFGKIAGVSGQYIGMIENGKNDNLKQALIELISIHFKVSSEWILSGTVNKNRRDYLQGGKLIQKWNQKNIAEGTGVPLKFIEALFNGEISPSDDFYQSVCEFLKIPPMEDFSDRRDEALKKFKKGVSYSRVSTVSGPPPDGYEIIPQDERIEKLRTQLDMCYERYFELQEENKTLRQENERLKAGK